MSFSRNSTFWRYLIYQIPGWAAVVGVLAGCVAWFDLSTTTAGALFVFWLVKDFAMYPVLKPAYRRSEASGIELVGRQGVAHDAIAPEGYVVLGAERWRARSNAPVPAGAAVRVTGVEGLTVLVESDPEAE